MVCFGIYSLGRINKAFKIYTTNYKISWFPKLTTTNPPHLIIASPPSNIFQAATRTAQLLDSCKGKVLFIDEAYGLDPSRRTNTYGGDVLDTLVEKIEGSAGSDLAVIMAGYEPQMRDMFRNSGNPGLNRRFNLDDALLFEDFSDDDLKTVLLGLIRKEGLRTDSSTVDLAVGLISQRRRLDNFGNAGEVGLMVGRAMQKLAGRKQAAMEARRKRDKMLAATGPVVASGRGAGRHSAAAAAAAAVGGGGEAGEEGAGPYMPTEEECVCDPYELIASDFINVETSAEKARDAFADLENVDHVLALLQELEDTLAQAKGEGRSAADILDDAHMIFTGPVSIIECDRVM